MGNWTSKKAIPLRRKIWKRNHAVQHTAPSLNVGSHHSAKRVFWAHHVKQPNDCFSGQISVMPPPKRRVGVPLCSSDYVVDATKAIRASEGAGGP